MKEESTVKSYVKPKTEDFVIMFDSITKLLDSNCTQTEYRLMLSLCVIVEYNTNRLFITPSRRVEIREKLGGEKILNNGSYSTAFKGLLDKKIILVIEGNYVLSPYFFWKGELAARARLMKTITTNVINARL